MYTIYIKLQGSPPSGDRRLMAARVHMVVVSWWMAGIHNYIREYSQPAHFYNIPTDHLGQRIIAAQSCLEYSHCSRILTTTKFCMLTSARQKYCSAKYSWIFTLTIFSKIYINGSTISGIFTVQPFQGYIFSHQPISNIYTDIHSSFPTRIFMQSPPFLGFSKFSQFQGIHRSAISGTQILSPWLEDKVDSGIGLMSTLAWVSEVSRKNKKGGCYHPRWEHHLITPNDNISSRL